MADPDVSHSSNSDEDQDFDPSSGDVTMHEMDDERTLDEEEALSNEESVANELDDLHKESEIPVEMLLAMYGYCGGKQTKATSSQASSMVESSECATNNNNEENINNNDNVTITTSNRNNIVNNVNNNNNSSSGGGDDDNLPSSSSSSSSSNHPSSSTTKQHQYNNSNNVCDNEVNTNNNNNYSMTNDSDLSQNSQGENSNQISSESTSCTIAAASTPSSHTTSSTSSNITSFANIVASSGGGAGSSSGGNGGGGTREGSSSSSSGGGDKTTGSDVVGSSNGAGLAASTADLLSADLMDVASDDDEDYDPEQEEEDWKKSVSVGAAFQATVPEFLSKEDDVCSNYNMEDRMLWSPENLNEADVEAYLLEVHRQHQLKSNHQPPHKNLPLGAPGRDDEQALYLLHQCNNNFEEALRRQKHQALPQPDPMSLWTEEECRNFETGLRLYGKDFFLNQQKVKTRSVREIVQFYYLWKKTERHDAFTARTRMEKKKYNLHPGVTDYMDRFISEFETPLVDTSSSSVPPHKHCILSQEMLRRMDSKHATFPISNYVEAAASTEAQCCERLMVYCNMPAGVSCSYDDANPASNLFPQAYNSNNSSNCHLLPNDVSSTANFFASSIYEYPITTTPSVNNHLPSCSGLPSSYHLQHQPDLNCYPSQVDSTYMPVATQVFGSSSMCSSPSSLSFHAANPAYYPVVDSLTSSFPNKADTDCLMPEVDMDSLIASSQMSSVVGPQELSISEINMIFGNVERPSCDLTAAAAAASVVVVGNSNSMAASNSRGGDVMGAGDASAFSGVSCMASSSDTAAFLPPSMQKLCSDDGVGATLESISASIQELVGPENSISPENLLSVLEGDSINSSSSSSSSSSMHAPSSTPINTSTTSAYSPLLASVYSSDDKISSCSGFSKHHSTANHHDNSPLYNTQHHLTHLAESSTFCNEVQHPTNSISLHLASNRYNNINNNNNNNNNSKSNFSVSSSNNEDTDHSSLHNDLQLQHSQQHPSPPPSTQQPFPSDQQQQPSSPQQHQQQPPLEHSIELPPSPQQSSTNSSLQSSPTPHHAYQGNHSHLISSSSTPSTLLLDPSRPPPISSDFSKACSDSTSIKS